MDYMNKKPMIQDNIWEITKIKSKIKRIFTKNDIIKKFKLFLVN